MKRRLSIFLVLLLIFSCMANIAFATEVLEESEEDSGETYELTDEELQQLLAQYGQEESDVDNNQTEKYIKAKVVTEGQIVEEENYYVIQKCNVKIKEGEHKGEELEAKVLLGYVGEEDEISEAFKPGEDVFVVFYEEEGTQIPYIIELDRTNNYILIAIILVVLIGLVFLLRGIEIVGLIAYNTLVLSIFIINMYLKEANELLSMSVILLLIIVGNILIINKFKKESLVAILSVIISTVITFALMIGINNMLKLDGFVGLFDVAALAMILPTVGIAIDVCLKTIEESKNGNTLLKTIKDISPDMAKKYNVALLIWGALFMQTAISIQAYLAESYYPTTFLNFGSIAIELAKFAVIILNPMIVIPISILLSKEILKIRKGIEAPAEEK